jgi:hypothetical protein
MSSTRTQIPVEEVASTVEKTFEELDQARAAGLGELALVTNARLTVLARDQRRLTEKLGPDHPRVAALVRTIDLCRALVLELRVAEKSAAVTPPDVDEKSWALHGHVISLQRTPVAHVTLALYARDSWVRELGYACTNEDGYFVIKAAPARTAYPPLSVHVLRSGATLHIDPQSIEFELGRVEYREVTLPANGDVCTPPETGSAPPSQVRDDAEAAPTRRNHGERSVSTDSTLPDRPAAQTRTVRGRVVQEGRGAPSAVVTVLGTPINGVTAEDGVFRLFRVPTETLTLRVTMAGFPPKEVTLTADQTAIEIVLP